MTLVRLNVAIAVHSARSFITRDGNRYDTRNGEAAVDSVAELMCITDRNSVLLALSYSRFADMQ